MKNWQESLHVLTREKNNQHFKETSAVFQNKRARQVPHWSHAKPTTGPHIVTRSCSTTRTST